MRKRKRRDPRHDEDAKAESPVVRARRFDLVDERGRVRAVLGEFDFGGEAVAAYGLELYDEAGSVRMALLLGPLGPTCSVSAAGNIVLSFGHDDPHPEVDEIGPFVQLMKPSGARAVLWRVNQDGSLWHEAGEPN